MARRTREQAAATREAIIDAGIDVFFRQGVAKASLEEVARSCGLTRGAVYWHFAGKIELFMAVEDRLRAPQKAELEALLAMGSSADPLLALKSTIVRILTEIANDRQLHQLMTIVLLRVDCSEDVKPAIVRQGEHQQHFHDGLRQYFAEVVPRPPAASGWTSTSASDAVFAMVQGSILRALRFPDHYPLHQVGIPTVKSFLDVLRLSWLKPKK